MSEADTHWMWSSDPYDTTTMSYTRKAANGGWDWMGSVKFSTLNRNYIARCRYAVQQEFLHKKDAKAWVEVTAKLGYAAA